MTHYKTHHSHNLALRLVMGLMMATLLAACGSKKALSDGSGGTITAERADARAKREFVRQAATRNTATRNIVANASFTLKAGSKNLSCNGTLRMRRDEVIRLQLLLPVLRTEIARVDFTPDHVLLVDRYHKEYMQVSYDQVSFLADNGITFYSLQSLFWNELFLPGEKTADERQLGRFDCHLDQSQDAATLSCQSGRLSCTWTVDRRAMQIRQANVDYAHGTGASSSLTWLYDNFCKLADGTFPCRQQFAVNANVSAKHANATVTIDMDEPKTSDNWDSTTDISKKYRKIEASDLLGKLLNMQ